MRLPKPVNYNVIEIKFLDEDRVVGKKYQLGKVNSIEQESARTYLIHYDKFIERIHNVHLALIDKEN